ncbi:putative bifunctional diguanylate cyclase/phosphodiesterase [Prosthecomicrobium pneumaticum]|uniref:Diguanylate cyclase (GGDEF)-like protein n=1 Tax=Prosthecomicrobium pneumaticum TaxID=81895 RepID=A0A7W9CTT9_9HYPH|nr:EAL domain-containing protein [Prosthecomicrobium pneumaticum]MBB5751778.1 diguanylate cyclase (GGDEF)-like protein [Prosthecomicrobium pneumaticum]
MTEFVEEFTAGIERETHFTDIRDLVEMWHTHAVNGPPSPERFGHLLAQPIGERLVIVDLEANLVRYRHCGRLAASLLGFDPLHRAERASAAEVEAEAARRFRVAIDAGVPVLQLDAGLGFGRVEWLTLPLAEGPTRSVLSYLRSREEFADLFRAALNASLDSASALAAIRDSSGAIVDFRFLAVNLEGARRLGETRETLLGRLVSERAPYILEPHIFERYVEAVETGRPIAFEVQFEHNGIQSDRAIKAMPFRDGIVIVGTDIGPLRKSARALEEQRNAVVEASALLAQRAADLTALNLSLERTTAELRDKIRRNAALESELKRRAEEDGLTGLANRQEFEQRCAAKLDEAAAHGRRAALAMIDLDHFKDVNDTVGHSAGDAVLVETARRLRAAVGPEDLVGRIGGDEFAVLFAHAAEVDDAVALVERLLVQLAEPHVIAGQSVPMGGSAGIAIFPDHARSNGDLFSRADMALYMSKRSGRQCVTLFTPKLRDETEQRIAVQKRFGLALKAGEIVPYYQPLLEIHTARLTGFEALARWDDPVSGMLTPARFVAALEDPALGQALTETMVARVLADLARWRDTPVPRRVGINITAGDLRRAGFVQQILGGLASYALSGAELVIEVTEGVMLSRSADRLVEPLETLRRNGVKIALDDFGTGYASLSHLMSMTVDSIKIDKSFVADLGCDPKAGAIVEALVRLAQTLGLKTIAEGVETREQLQMLSALGCDVAQGYLIAPPMPASEVPDFVRAFDAQRPERFRRRRRQSP